MALTVTDNSVRQINAALLSLEKKIGETNSEKAQDKQVVQMEIKNVQYNFMAPLHQSGVSVSIDTTGTWEGNARSATNAEHAITADNIEHANTATSANLSKTLDTTNGDKLQIGSGTAQNVTNAKHAANADIKKTLDTTNGDKLQIGTGAAINVTNAKHSATADNGVPAYSTSDAGKNLAVNSSGNAVGWVKPQKIKIADYRTGQFTWTSVGQQEKIGLSNFGSDVTESNVLCFMVIYWSGVKTIAEADWAKSQGTGSSGMACALTALGTGSGYSVIRCVYLV